MYLHTDQNQFSQYERLDVVNVNLLILIFYKLMNLRNQVNRTPVKIGLNEY